MNARNGGPQSSGSDLSRSGRIEWVRQVSFCDKASCTKLASWRIGMGTQSMVFCPNHTVSVMKDRRVWTRLT